VERVTVMDHKYFQSRLSAFADGELPADEQTRVAEHLEQCQDCARRVDELQRLEELTERESKLDDSDYWETAAQRIEAKLDRSATPITDLSKGPVKSKSSLWWKLPAIAASVVLVGYIGLHQSDILQDDIMIPPQEATTPSPTPIEKPDAVQAEKTTAAPKEAMSLTPPDTNRARPVEGVGVEDSAVGDTVVERQEMSADDIELGFDRSDAESLRDVPPSPTIDEFSQSVAIPIEPEVSEVAEETDATPAPSGSKTRSKATASAARVQEAEDWDIVQEDKTNANYRDKKEEPIMTDREFTPPPLPPAPPSQRTKRLDKVSPEDTESRLALDQVFELENWRHQRDSLVALIAELEPDTTGQKRRPLAIQGFAATKSGSRGQAVDSVADRSDLLWARADLVEVWCRICRASDDEAEVSDGIEFLQRMASDSQSISGIEAEACLELIFI